MMGRKPMVPRLHDREWLQAQIDAGTRVSVIARELGCSNGAVNEALQRNGIQHAHSRHERTACPYCGGDYTPGTVDIHAARCKCNPQVRAATLALLDDGDGGCVTVDEYRERYRRTDTCAMSVAGIRTQVGGWANVTVEFGLLDAEAKILRDIDRQREEAERAMAERWEMNRGLRVASVRQVGGEVYCMLR